jgi:shikimate dehydrogenase/3-dehydroquinate dehydratase type I
MALVCVSLAERTARGLVRAARAARERGADLVELRLDHLRQCDAAVLGALRRRISFVPAIATLRPAREGGRYRGGEPARLALLEQAIACGFEYVDLELSIGKRGLSRLAALARRRGVGTVVSHHDLARTPPTAGIVRRLEACARAGDLGKAAFAARSPRDAVRIIEAARRTRRTAPGAVAIGMGPAGAITRTLGPFLGSRLVYAGLDRKSLTARGQPDLAGLQGAWAVAGGIGRVSASTGLYGILGHPLGHSLSPLMHNTAFGRLGLDAAYLPFDVDARGLAPTLAALRAAGLRGANVTIPHKSAVIPLLDGIDAHARSIGAVNTIVSRGGKLRGHNTDVAGFVGALGAAGVRLEGARALVVGAGGAARAAVAGLLENGAAVTVVNRGRRRAEELAGRLGGARIAVADICDIGPAAERSEIIVNCTPAGMKGFPRTCPVPPRRIARGAAVMDMVYNPARTRLLAEAEKRGARTVSGMEMFIRQGMEAFRLWTGKPFPEKAVRKALAHSRLSTN